MSENKSNTGKKNDLLLCKSGRCLYLCRRRFSFTAGDTRLIVEDRINLFLPWRSQRVLKIAGRNALYSSVPLWPGRHKLLCYQYCAETMKKRDLGFYHHVLVLGCGGGALPRWLLEEYPDLLVDVVDISKEIIAVCKEYFLKKWKNSERLTFICTDAREFEQKEYSYEFIFCDLFDGANLAPLVYNRDFVKNLYGMLADKGILVVNCGWVHLGEVIREIYQETFEEVEPVNRKSGQTEVLQAVKREN